MMFCGNFLLIFCVLYTATRCEAKSIMTMMKNPKLQLNNISEEADKDPAAKAKEIEDDLAPPKHLDAVKIGRDGNINSNFHKEVFLGEDVENFENGNYELKDQKDQLVKIFKTIDTNHDKFLTESELSDWVLSKTREHFNEAKQDNSEKFSKIDQDHDDRITWNEYLVEFLGQRNFDKKEVADKLAANIKIEINPDIESQVEDARDKWIQSASQDDQNSLTAEQFLDFLHPETSKGMLQYLVEDYMHDIDVNGDEKLSLAEYMSIPSDADADTQTDEWAIARREEFRTVMDKNDDGYVTKDELEKYLDPLSPTMAEQEARQLIAFGDENLDEKLSLDELLENSEFYTGSKLYNYARSVHDDL